jgi:hypothetical protein
MNPRVAIYGVSAAIVITAAWLASQTDLLSEKTAGSSDATPRTAEGRPDLTGFWAASGAGPVEADAEGDIVYNINSRDGSAPNFERDDTLRRRMNRNRPVYKPEFWDKLQHLDDNRNQEDGFFSCMPAGLPRMGPPTKIVQTPTELVFLYAAKSTFRVIPIDGRPHHPVNSLDQTFTGDSVGRWEGDTLVVDVIGFNDITWLDYQGYFHTPAMRVVERFRREGNRLHYDVTVEDPAVLVEPWVMTTRTLNLNTDPNAIMIEDSPCDERDLEHLTTKEHH